MKARKRIQRGGSPSAKGKGIADAALSTSSSDQKFQWEVSLMDTGVGEDDSCRWTWDLTPDELQELMAFLAHSSRRTWAEIEGDRTGRRNRHKKHHNHDVADICKEAQTRLHQHIDESHDKLFRFRYAGEKRIWGVRDRAVFRMIWADLHHQVYPTDPN